MKHPLTREEIANRVAMDIPDGSYVNLGIGIPALVAGYVTPDKEVVYHSENGILGLGPLAPAEEGDPDIINANKQMVQLVQGASIFSHADSFTMLRGGHIDIGVLGALQVSEHGDLANWKVPGESIPGVGGAMDIAVGARRVFVIMTHVAKDGSPKVVERCTFPLTAPKCVERIYTDLAVIDVTEAGLLLREVAPGYSVADVQAVTAARLLTEGPVPEVNLGGGSHND